MVYTVWGILAYVMLALVVFVANLIVIIKQRKNSRKLEKKSSIESNDALSSEVENKLPLVDFINALVAAVGSTEVQMKSIAPSGGGVIKKNLALSDLKNFCEANNLPISTSELSSIIEIAVKLININKNSRILENPSESTITR